MIFLNAPIQQEQIIALLDGITKMVSRSSMLKKKHQ